MSPLNENLLKYGMTLRWRSHQNLVQLSTGVNRDKRDELRRRAQAGIDIFPVYPDPPLLTISLLLISLSFSKGLRWRIRCNDSVMKHYHYYVVD